MKIVRKTIFVVWMVLIAQIPVMAGADECLEGDCDNGIGKGFTEDGKLYSGAWKDGLPHGFGKIIPPGGRSIEGRWEKGDLVEEQNMNSGS